jgi:hypothetical protein
MSSSGGGTLQAAGVPLEQFMPLTRIPIVIDYGDNIPAQPHANPGQDQWRVRLAMAKLWAEAVNRRRGDETAPARSRRSWQHALPLFGS